MHGQDIWNVRLLVMLAVLGWFIPALSQTGSGEPLPRIGAAPEFTLTTQDGQRLALQELRDRGWNCLYFHYRGCWGSEGAYSLHHLTIDASAAVEWATAQPSVS